MKKIKLSSGHWNYPADFVCLQFLRSTKKFLITVDEVEELMSAMDEKLGEEQGYFRYDTLYRVNSNLFDVIYQSGKERAFTLQEQVHRKELMECVAKKFDSKQLSLIFPKEIVKFLHSLQEPKEKVLKK